MMWLKLLTFWMVALAVAINRTDFKVILTQDGSYQGGFFLTGRSWGRPLSSSGLPAAEMMIKLMIIEINEQTFNNILDFLTKEYLQYDLETPPLVEFTFCMWVRLNDLDPEQTFFSYYVERRNRTMLRLWLDPGGRNIQFTINGYLALTYPIEVYKDVWKHICLSYQSDYGAFALYADSRLITCGTSRIHRGFAPAGGSVSVGYGRSTHGEPRGVEGEIFGANMILMSTIERNYTKIKNPRLRQRRFRQNTIMKIKDTNTTTKYEYIVLDEIKDSDILNNYLTTPSPSPSSSPSLFNLTTLPTTHSMSSERLRVREVLDIAIPIRTKIKTIGPTTSTTQYNESVNKRESYSAETRNQPSISEFKIHPSPTQKRFFKPKHAEKLSISTVGLSSAETQKDYYRNSVKEHRERLHTSQEDYELSETKVPPPQTDNKVYLSKSTIPTETQKDYYRNSVKEHRERLKFSQEDYDYELSETEVPQPQTDNKGYSRQSPGLSPTVTQKNYFRNSVKEHRERLQTSQEDYDYEPSETEVPQPQTDNNVYLSKSTIGLSSTETQKDYFRNSMKEHRERSQTSQEDYYYEHSETEVPPQKTDRKVYAQEDSSEYISSILNNLRTMQSQKRDKAIPVNNPSHNDDAFPYSSELKLTKIEPPAQFERRNLGGKPKLSYSDFFSKRRPTSNVEIWEDDLRERIQRSHTKRKARNVNIITTGEPKLNEENNEHHEKLKRQVKYSSSESDESIETPSPRPFTISDKQNIITDIYEGFNYNKNSKSNETLRYTYKRDTRSLSEGNKWHNIKLDYTPKPDLHSEHYKEPVIQGQSLAKTVLSQAEVSLNQIENTNTMSLQQLVHEFSLSNITKREKVKKNRYYSRNFNKQINLENYLNDIGNINSFEGDSGLCNDAELYVQPDASIDLTPSLSPVKFKNHAIEFIEQSYKFCSYEGSLFEEDPLLNINWSKTPVRLVGGAYLQITTEFCGFFKS